jgi:hypothetical protein
MATFKLIIEEGCPVAAIVPWEITDRQLDIVYCMLPEHCRAQLELPKRWCPINSTPPPRSDVFSAEEMTRDRVLSTDDWAQQQLHRRPMLKPKSVELAFL